MPLGLFPRDLDMAQAPGVGEFGTSPPPQPGIFTGLWSQSPFSSAIGEGALKAAQVSGAGSADLLSTMSPNPDFFTPPDVVQVDPEELALHQATEQQRVIDAFKTNPRLTGGAANLIHSVTSPLTQMALGTMATGGNPLGGAVAVGAGEGYALNQEMRVEHPEIDKNTRRALAAGTALFAGAGALLPGGLGETLAMRIASGAAAQETLGVVNRGMMSKVLDQAGYPEQAKAYVALDGMAMLSDAVLGAGFGAVHHIFAPDVQDAARVVRDSVNAEHSAPGVPVDGASRQGAIDSVEAAKAALIRGDETPAPSADVRTVPNPAQDAAREASATAVQDAAGEIGAERVEAPVAPLVAPELELLHQQFPVGSRITYLQPGEGIVRKSGIVVEHRPSGKQGNQPYDASLRVDFGRGQAPERVTYFHQPELAAIEPAQSIKPKPAKAETDPLAAIDPSDREILAHAETVLRDKPNGTFSEQLRAVIDDIRQSSGIGEELHRIAAACGWRG